MAMEEWMTQLGPFIGQAFLVLEVILLFIIPLVLLAVFGWYAKYNIIVQVFEQRKNGIKLRNDKGKIIKEDGTPKLKLFWSRQVIAPPNLLETMYSKGKKDVYILYKERPDINCYQPVTLSANPGEFKTMDQDVQFWHQQQTRKTIEKYSEKNFWDKYGGLIAIGVCAGIFVLTLIFCIREIHFLIEKIAGLQNLQLTLPTAGAPGN